MVIGKRPEVVDRLGQVRNNKISVILHHLAQFKNENSAP